MQSTQGRQTKAVVFDVYGTLVEILDKRRPFRQLLQGLPADYRSWQSLARIVMSEPLEIEQAAQRLNSPIPEEELRRLRHDLEEELASIRSFPDAPECLAALQTQGLKLAICSNLAKPYAEPVRRLLPISWDAAIWSFEVQAIKPEDAIYARLCQQLDLAPGEVLMVGDTEDEDYLAPLRFGMQAIRLRRNNVDSVPSVIHSLAELPHQIR